MQRIKTKLELLNQLQQQLKHQQLPPLKTWPISRTITIWWPLTHTNSNNRSSANKWTKACSRARWTKWTQSSSSNKWFITCSTVSLCIITGSSSHFSSQVDKVVAKERSRMSQKWRQRLIPRMTGNYSNSLNTSWSSRQNKMVSLAKTPACRSNNFTKSFILW